MANGLPGPHTIMNRHNGQTVNLMDGGDQFFVDGQGHPIKPLRNKLLIAIAANAPAVTAYGSLYRTVNAHNFGSPQADDLTVLYKLAHGINKAFKDACQSGVIENVSGSGYRLATNWAVVPADGTSDFLMEDLQMLDAIARSCIQHVRTSPIVTNEAGITSLRCDDSLANQNFRLVNHVMWRTLRTLSLQRIDPAAIISVKRKFEDLLTYVVFWRIGDDLPVDKWRRDYEAEITVRLGDVIASIRRHIDRPAP